MRGQCPIARLRVCHPLTWKVLCTVFLLNPQQISHRPVTERGLFLDHGLNPLNKSPVYLGHRLAWLEVDAATGDAEPSTEFRERNLKTIVF